MKRRRRKGLGENAATYRRLARDAERQGRTAEAQAIYAQAPRYRTTGVVKRLDKTGKIRRYKNLAAFNRECPVRGDTDMLCTLQNVRQLTDGSGMASVRAVGVPASAKSRTGTWRLHFADYSVMINALKRRVTMKRPKERW